MLPKKDLMILSHLRKNARMSLTDISRQTGIPVSTVFDRLKQNSVIQKYVALVDFQKLGFVYRAKVIIKVEKNSREEIKKFLVSHPCVNSLYEINSGSDFLIDAVHKNIKDFYLFIEELESKYSIREKQVFNVINELKKEEFMLG